MAVVCIAPVMPSVVPQPPDRPAEQVTACREPAVPESLSYTAALSWHIDHAFKEYRPGDHEAEASLYRALLEQSKHIVRYNLRDRDGELSHAIVHRAIRAIPRFRGDSRLSTWFYILARNEVRREQRRRITARQKFVGLDIADKDFSHASKASEKAMCQLDSQIELERLFRRLPKEQAEVMSARLDGYSLAETARLLGQPIGTIRSRSRLAKEKLRRLHRATTRERKSDMNPILAGLIA